MTINRTQFGLRLMGALAVLGVPLAAHAFTFSFESTSFFRNDIGLVPNSDRMAQLWLGSESGTLTLADGESTTRKIHQAEFRVEGKKNFDYEFLRTFSPLVGNERRLELSSGTDFQISHAITQAGTTFLTPDDNTLSLDASSPVIFDFGNAGTVTVSVQSSSLTTDDTIEGEMFADFRYDANAPVPEPFTMILGAAALGAAALRRRRAKA